MYLSLKSTLLSCNFLVFSSAKRSITMHVQIDIFLVYSVYALELYRDVSLFSLIPARMKFLSLLNVPALHSHSHEVTGKVHAIFSREYYIGKEIFITFI